MAEAEQLFGHMRKRTMRPVEEEDRLAALRSLGLSESVLRLASGRSRRRFFADYRTPVMVYYGSRRSRGPLFVPLWEKYDTVSAVRRKGQGLEFFAFSIERPEEPWALARTEQGLLATLFFQPLNAYHDDRATRGRGAFREIQEAAEAIGFRYLRQANGVIEKHYPNGFTAFKRAFESLVRGIDRGRVGDTR